MKTNQEESLFPRIKLIRFECVITLASGGKKYVFIDLPPLVEKGCEINYKDGQGNSFQYNAIYYDNTNYNPNIDCELFKENEGKFSDNYFASFFNAYQSIRLEIETKEEIEFLDEHNRIKEENKELKEQLKKMRVKHKIYFKEFDDIYNDNLQGMENLTKEEVQYIKSNGYRKITRYTAFLILLYRHKDDTDFLLKVDLKDEDSIKNLYDNYYNAYRQ